MTSETLDQAFGSAPIKRVAFGGATAFAIFMASAGVTACAQLLVARLIGAETYGVYAYVIAWMTILAYFSALGFDIALLRFVSAYQTTGRMEPRARRHPVRGTTNARRRHSCDVDGDVGRFELAPAVFTGAKEHVSRWIHSCSTLGVAVGTLLHRSRIRRRGARAGAGQSGARRPAVDPCRAGQFMAEASTSTHRW